MFLEISQNSQENICARPATLLKKRLWHRCFLVNFVKFLRTLFFIKHLWWLLLKKITIILNYKWEHKHRHQLYIFNCEKPYRPFATDRMHLTQACKVYAERVSFNSKVSRNSWYSFYRPRTWFVVNGFYYVFSFVCFCFAKYI